MGLEGHDGEPEVEGRGEDEGAEGTAAEGSGATEEVVEEKKGTSGEGEEEVEVEVEDEVAEVKVPGFGAVEVGAIGGEDVVVDDVPGDDDEFLVEEGVDGDLKGEDEEESDKTIGDTPGEVDEAAETAEGGEHGFLGEKGQGDGGGKGPADAGSDSETEDALSGAESAPPVQKGGQAEQSGVHGETAGEVGGAGVIHPWGGEGDGEVGDGDPAVEERGEGSKQTGLTESTNQGEGGAEEVEFEDLGGGGEDGEDSSQRGDDEGVDARVGPGSDGKVGGIFPGLQGVAVAEVMGGFPVVEDLVAVGDGAVDGGEEVTGEEEVEGGVLIHHGGVVLHGGGGVDLLGSHF